MSALPKDVADFMERYKVASDEMWQVPDGAWVVKHKALERVAAEQGIVFEPPQIATRDFANEGVAVLVLGKLGDRSEWSFGEASNFNLTRKSEKRPLYPWAMAEKRAKDRVALKLLNIHGSVYSEEEGDELKEAGAVHTNGVTKHTTLPKKDAREVYAKMQREVQECATREQLKEWMKGNADRVKVLPEDWQDILRLQCEEMLADLRQREAA
jgi:hypothetical protein